MCVCVSQVVWLFLFFHFFCLVFLVVAAVVGVKEKDPPCRRVPRRSVGTGDPARTRRNTQKKTKKERERKARHQLIVSVAKAHKTQKRKKKQNKKMENKVGPSWPPS